MLLVTIYLNRGHLLCSGMKDLIVRIARQQFSRECMGMMLHPLVRILIFPYNASSVQE
jgi:hypothetical protein